MPDNRYYYFKDAKGNRHTVNKAAFDNDREGFAKAFPGARMEVIDRKTGRRGDVDVKDAGRVGDFGAHLFTGQTVRREKYQPKTSLGKAALRVAQEKWGGNEVTKPNYASLGLTKPVGGNEPHGASVGLSKPLGNGKESALVKGLREADALKRRDEEQMPIDYTKPSAVKQMVGRTRREQQTLDRRIEQAGREAGKDVMKPLREKEARLKTPVVDTGDVDINSHIINTQEQADRQLAESGLEFANKHLDDYVSDNILNEFKTATAKGAAAESALSKASPFAYMAAGKAYNEALDPDKLLKHLQEKANADIAKVLSQPKMQEEIGLKAAAYGISPEEYIEKSLIPGLQTKLVADFDKSELSRSMPKSTAEYILRGVNESMLGTIMSMGMTSKKQRQYAQQGMAMTDYGENPDVNPGMAARVARGTLGFVADAPVFGAAGKAGAAVAGKVFGNGVAQTARIANSTLGGRIARMAGSGMVSQGITGVLYGSTNAAVQNYSTGDDTSIGNTVKVMAMGGLSEGASWATMGGIGGAVGAGIYNVSGAKRIPAKAFQLAMEGIGMHIGGNVAKTIEGHDTDWTSIEGNLEACANVVALKLTHARLPKRQSKDGVKESYLDMVARNINGLMTSDGQRAAFGGYTFTNEEKEQLFGSASAPKRTEALYGYDVHDNPLTRKESLTSWAMRAKKTAAKGKGEESYKDTDVEFVKTAYDEIMADNSIPWDTKAKFSALVMGTVPSARPMMEICRIEGNSVNEYSKNGELLSKNSFKSIDERNSIIYSLNMKREDQRLSNAYGAAQIKDEKTAQATLEAVAEANGMTAEQLKAAMDKQPLRRSEEEQNACVALRKAYEDEQFAPGTLHAEQSNTEGKDVVEENGLGTETPNNEAASEVLGDLTKTEDALQAAMDSNDVLKEEYERMQKAGMSNPQIYMELFNAGLTQEQLAPLADYINTLSKAQGMFKGTQDKIVETTQKHVGQWSYKGELNGEKQNGEQMVFVKDDKGRVLIVGAGDVAFDGEGRVRDGDMLTVYDPATREMDFVHAKDVTLEHTTSSEEYAKDYQRQLEELNSTVYAEAQQRQSEEANGGKPDYASLSPTKPLGEEGNEASLGLSKPTKPLGEKETEPLGEKPVATFADGTPVPMMKDSKGRETADYSQMTSEQGAEWMASQFGENAEAAVDGQIKRAEKTMKDAEKIKVDYTGDLNDAKEAEAQKTMAVDAAKKELELYTNIKKAMTEKKVKAGMEKVSSVGGVGEEGSVGSVGVAREKFESGLRVVGNKRTRTLADGNKLRGHYEIVDADSLTPSHNANDGYKKSEGFPVNEEGRTINDRDYENDKQAQLVTDMIAMKYDGQAVDQVPVVTSDGIVVDGNGRTMAGQKAAKNGTDSAYLEALKENAENYGFTAEQIEQSGIKHPRLVLVSDEPMKYDTATFAKFNKNEKKAQGNTQQAVANSKKLSADEISAIVSEIEGSGNLDAFFNNSSAINSLLTRLVDKGVIGLNEVGGLREGEDKLSAAGKDFVKNLLLGSVFSENTIRMMGADAMLKTKALNGIRAVTDNMKLGDYALMKEIDKAVQLLYEARQGGSGVDAYLRTPAMFGENAADRYDPISQAIALALEGKVEDFRELMMAYNRNAAPYADANQTEMFGERPTKEDFVNEFLKLRNWEDYETRHSSKEGNGDAGSTEGAEPQARGGSEPTEGEGLGSRGNTEQGENIDVRPAKKDSGTHDENTEGESGNVGLGSTDKGSRNNEGQREVDKAEEEREAASVRMQKADGYSEFADKHGLDDIWLARYAEAIKENNPGAANTALSNLKVMYLRDHTAEKKALMEREGVHGLIANKRLFEPIRNAIKEQYGDVDILVEEHRKQVEQKTNMMEAARKKAEEEERKRQARLEELAELTDEDIDNRYADALVKGDEAAAREMLDEAARRKGYGDADSDYQGVGAWSSPSKPDYETDEARRNAVGEDSPDLNVEDMAAGYNNQPEDIFVHPNKYSQGLPTSEESGKAIQTAIDDIRNGKKDVKLKVYRAVPTSVKEGKLRNGDWVTPSKKYAEIHGDNRLDGKYRIIEDEVPVNELWWDGNDVNEWGYDNGKSYRYKNVKNNRKQNDLVTRDDKGNVIPPSKRFNQRKADERYQRGVGGVKPSKAEVALRDAVIDRLRESGMDVIADEAEGQRVLDEANGKVRQMSFGEPYDYETYPLGRVEPNLSEKEVRVVEADADHGFANYKEAKAWAKEHVSKVYDNAESGGKGEVRISNAAIDKFMSQSAIDKSDSKDVHMAVLKVLPEVLKTSIDVETHPDFLKGEDGKRRAENGMNKDVLVHRCYGAVSIDGKPYRVKITLKEDPRDVSFPHVTHSYEATKIELLAGTWENHEGPSPNTGNSKQIEQRRNMVKPEGDNPNTNNSISAAKLLENVGMSYNSGEKVLDASKKRSEGVRFFRTANGEAYGFTVGGKIYIDPKIATSETPVHEYAHLWAEALRNGNSKEWQNVVELMKDTKVWDEVKARYPELKSDSEIADEVIATYSGRRGAERLRAEERKITESNSGVYEKIKTIGAFEKVKMSLDKFWKCVADFLHIRYTSAEEVADRVMKDLLDGVDPRGSEKGKEKSVKSNGNPRFQFIGEKGAAEADHAEEVSVRLDNLSVARDMEAEKKDAKTIKMATGWERGADGKWRYEIADMKEFDRNGNLLYRKHHPDYARYIELQDKELKNLFEDGEELTDKEREEYEALSKKYESDKFGGEKLDNIHTLEAYVDAPELFKAYPELRNVRMTFMDTGGDETASYHHISSVFGVDKDNVGEIVVNTGKVSVNTRTNEVKSAVLHEMQHAIQDMEGFAMGGNTERMKSDFLEAKAEWAARAYAHELEETAKALGEDYDQLGVERALIKEYEDMDMSDELPDKDTRIKGFNYFARGYADRSLDDAIKRFRLNESTRGDFNPYIEYSRLAGEVEARNVQKRMDMSAEERRASLAAETEDVAREDQIFLTGNNGVSKMDNRTEKHAADMNGKDNGVMYRIERAAEMYNKAKKLRFKKTSNEDSSKELYLSLQNKKGKEYYDTVTELARGMVGESGKAEGVVSEGQSQPRKTSVGRNTERIVGRPKSVVHCAAEIIAADTARSYRNGRLQQSERGLERGEKGALVSREKSSQSEVLSADVWENRVSDPVEREISKRIEDWAKQTNHWFDWRSLRTKYDRTKQLGDGTEAESDVFLSKDGKTVLKVVRSPHALYTSLQGKLNSIALHNKLFGDVGQTIIGITRTTETDALGKEVSTIGLLIEQPFVEGKPVADMFNNYGEEIAYIDKTMTALGFKPEKWVDNGGFFNGEPETVWRKGDVIVYDTHGNNIFIDKNGKPRLIDCGIETYKEYAKRHTIYDSAKARETEYENAVRAVKSKIRLLEKEVLNEERIIAMLRDNRREDNADKIDGFITYHEGKIAELKHKIRINAQALQKPGSVHYRVEPPYASLSLSKPWGGTENAKPLEGRIAETVEKVSKQTGGKVKMVNSVEEIGNEQVRRDIENGKQVTGWYDEKTGEVHLYMPNIHDAYTAEKTVWHETVGHKGMRGLLGDKFKDYMRGLWMDLDNPINAELRAYVKERMKKNSMGFYDAIEEFIAESAEKGKGEPGFWNYIKNKVTDALHEIGYRISPNVKDVKYMLWLAKNVQKKGNDPWWKMRADAVKWKIEHENVEYTKIHGGEFYENDGKNHDFEDMTKEEWDEATDGQIHYRTAPSAATALDRYHSMLNAHGYMATEAFMDNMLSLEKLMKAVDPSIKKIEDVKSSMNPYLMQNITEGKMSDKSELFRLRYMDPLSKAMAGVLDSFDGKKTEDRIRNFNLYMIRKHGLERNRVLFVRDKIREKRKVKSEESDSIDALEAAWNNEKSDLGQKLRSGQIDLREYYRQMDEWIVQNIDKDFKAEEHDYSGMHGLQGIADTKAPYDDAGAIDDVMSQEASMEGMKKGSVADFWKKVKAATDYSVNSDYDNNIISKETHDGVLGMFDWYVPLRKFDEATAEDVYGYVTEMGDPSNYIGTTLMNAKGRKSLSNVEILAQIGLMGNRAIRNGGQNSIKLAFARFVRNSGAQNLVKETKVWVKKTGTDANGNDIWEEAYPQIPDNANAHDVATIVDAFETDMKTKQAKGEAKTLSNSTDIGFKFARAKNKSEHFVDVKIAGRTHRFVVLGNPRAAQALNGMLENGKASQKWLQTLTRWMAMASTSWSPEFVMRNIVKDVEFASAHVMAKEGGRYFAKWARYYGELSPINMFYNEGAGALKNMKWKDFKGGIGYGLYARYREGTLGNTKMERYFKEFMENGGETGFVQLFSMHDMEKSYKGVVEKESANGVKKVAVNAIEVLKKVGENVESLNEVAENMARFATYCTSRDLGRSAARSAYDAKEVSTNFNRHGSGDAIKSFKNGEMSGWQNTRRNTYGFLSGYLRNYSMFFNAGIQSTNLLFKNFKNAPKGTATAMTAAPFALALIMAAVNNALIQNEDEKDRGNVKAPYGELPDYIRRNNLCIYVGKNRFVTVPLAIELRAFYSLGDLAAGQTFAENVKSQRNMAMDAVGCMSQLFPVVDFLNNPNYEKSFKNGAGMTVEAISPTAIVPLIEWWLNNDWKGAPIRRTGDKAELNPAWQNAYSNVPARLVDLNKWANAYSNDVAPGNPEMKGSDALDFITDPSMLNHFYESLSGGMGTTVKRSVGLAAKVATGKTDEIEVGDVPFLRSLFYTPREQSSMARTKAKWYSYKESMEKNMSNYSMLKNKNVPLTERIRNAADRHRFEQGADYARIRIIKDAEKQMKRWNKMKRLNADDKKQVDFANKNIEMIMQKAVEQMDGISEE